jgi:hypothetical protein
MPPKRKLTRKTKSSKAKAEEKAEKQERLKLAIEKWPEWFKEEVDAGREPSQRKFAKLHKVSRQTLRDNLERIEQNRAAMKPGRPTVLNGQQECQLAVHIAMQQAMGLPLSLLGVRKIATALFNINLYGPGHTAHAAVADTDEKQHAPVAEDDDLADSDDDEKEEDQAAHAKERPDDEVLLTKGWWKRFKGRYPFLTIKRAGRQCKDKSDSSNPTNVSRFYRLLKKIKEVVGPLFPYNVDESMLQLSDLKAKLVVGIKGTEAVCRAPKNSDHITVIECVSSHGDIMPPTFIYNGKTITLDMYLDPEKEAEETLVTATDSGWTSAEVFTEWMKAFLNFTKTQRDKQKLLLLLDGHMSHLYPVALKEAREQNVIVVCFPSNCTQILQPLDVGIFGTVKTAFRSEVERIMNESIDELSRYAATDAYMKARKRTLTKTTIKKAFAATGIEPLCPEIVMGSGKLSVSVPSSTKDGPVILPLLPARHRQALQACIDKSGLNAVLPDVEAMIKCIWDVGSEEEAKELQEVEKDIKQQEQDYQQRTRPQQQPKPVQAPQPPLLLPASPPSSQQAQPAQGKPSNQSAPAANHQESSPVPKLPPSQAIWSAPKSLLMMKRLLEDQKIRPQMSEEVFENLKAIHQAMTVDLSHQVIQAAKPRPVVAPAGRKKRKAIKAHNNGRPVLATKEQFIDLREREIKEAEEKKSKKGKKRNQPAAEPAEPRNKRGRPTKTPEVTEIEDQPAPQRRKFTKTQQESAQPSTEVEIPSLSTLCISPPSVPQLQFLAMPPGSWPTMPHTSFVLFSQPSGHDT